MNKYESVIILNPSLEEDAVHANIDKFKGIIENGGGAVENVDLWGKRKLAYEINKLNEGIYVLFNFNGDAALPKELDRNYRITDDVMRHLIVKLK